MPTSPQPKPAPPDDTPLDVVGVPRRFGTGRLLALITFFAIVFAVLRWLGANWVAYLMVGLFFVAMGLGQMVLYGGRRPRAASCVAGAVVLPVLSLVGMMVASAADLGGLRNIPGHVVAELISVSIFLIPIGAGFGYLAGGLVAGLFLVMDRRWDAGAHRPGRPQPRRRRLRRLLGRIRRRPGRSALMCFAALGLLGMTFTPFVPYPWWWHIAGSLTVAGTIAFGVPGLFLSGRRMVLLFTLLGPVAAIGPAMMAWPIDVNMLTLDPVSFDRPDEPLAEFVSPLLLIGIGGWAMGWLVLSLLGWLRHELTGRHPKRHRRVAVRVARIGVLGLGVLAGVTMAFLYWPWQRTLLVRQLQQHGVIVRGTERSLTVNTNGVLDGETVAQLARLGSVRCLILNNSRVSDQDLAQLRPLKTLERLSLSGTSVTDRGLVHLAGLRNLETLDLSWTHVTGTGFRSLGALRLQNLWLRDADVNDPGLSEIVKSSPSVAVVVLDATKVSETGLNALVTLRSPFVLSLKRLPVTDRLLEQLAKKTSLQELDISGTQVTAYGIQRLTFGKRGLNVIQEISVEGLASPPDAVVIPEDETDGLKEEMESQP